MADKRRLPVLGNQGPNDPGELPEERSPAAWVMLGVLAVFTVLVPLAMIVMAIAKGAPSPGFFVVASVLCVGLSAYAGGYLVGRFGNAGPFGGAVSGALAGLLMWALSRAALGVVIVPLTAAFAHFGARAGKNGRKPGDKIAAG